ncbi:MAG: beta-N-acetylhexosaminidase [Clostridia bacterium]|nr:beta-N-acetylhexosaminidase [Clostridia bacterium]
MRNAIRRGVMLDCSRNAVMTVSALKKLIALLAKMGYNAFQLYTEDTYEIEGEPMFGRFRGRYSKEELKEVDAYCSSLGVELIPCIQTLGHLNQIFHWPTYSKSRDIDAILLVDEEETYRLIEKMFAACADCFTSRSIHIGMDEAHTLGRGKFFDKHGFEEHHEIFLRHLNRVCEVAGRYGFKPMMWSDMFFRLAFGTYYVKEGEIPDEVKAKVPENIELVYWDYYSDDLETYEKMLDKHLSMNRNVVFAGGAWKWCTYTPNNAVSIRRTELAVNACKEKGVKDVFITAWGDDGGECSPFAVLPALFYASECLKGNSSLDGIEERFEAVTGESWEDMMALDLTLPKGVKALSAVYNSGKTMLFSDPFMGRFDSLVFGTGEERVFYEAQAEKLAEAKTRSKSYAYLFESMEKFCAAVAVKYDLGYRTRVAYQAGNKAALAAILADYDESEKRVLTFYEAYRKQWFAENKGNGFEVQDIRFGGLVFRIKHCRQRLKAYLDGMSERIGELEEPFVDYRGGEMEKAYAPFVTWRGSVTSNVL